METAFIGLLLLKSPRYFWAILIITRHHSPHPAIDPHATGTKGFPQRYGLAQEPVLIRLRILDPALAIQGLRDLTVPVHELAALQLPVEQIFITKNKINGLSFPSAPKSIVIFQLGYSPHRLGDIPWLGQMPVHYWGDIDTHDFTILNKLRTILPHVQSFLMDRATLLAHHTLWGEEPIPYLDDLGHLHAKEHALFVDLQKNRLGNNIRLEQKRIDFGLVQKTVRSLTT